MKHGLVAFGAALAMTLAGASHLWAGDRDESWGALLHRCDQRMSRTDEARLSDALDRLTERQRARLSARLKRIDLLTKAWVRAERQARCAAAARAVMNVFGAGSGVPVDLRPTLDMILQLNGLGTKKEPGVLGRKGKELVL
ncbi:MAG: hypothetical protein K8T20_06100 [Planctomycetes bacterium]|nr:hypothetical protein [Planctomycetota bacterium]